MVEDPDLIKFCNSLGFKPPGRKRAAGPLLETVYEHVKVVQTARIPKPPAAVGQLATDGWKSKSAEQGASLINVLLLLPNGGAIFWTAINAAGVSKDAAWVVQLHEDMAAELTEGDMDRLLGVVLDNTATNVSALRTMEQLHPRWVGLGCQAHALALLIKDLAHVKNGSSKFKWAATLFAQALDISNTIGGSERIRALVQSKQQELHGRVKAITSNVPTRWGTNCFVLESVLGSKEAIKAACTDDEWQEVSKSSTKADDMHKAAVGARTRFWADGQHLVVLTTTIMDAIHQIEADKPLLSQMRLVW